jgi:hypothetical protein
MHSSFRPLEPEMRQPCFSVTQFPIKVGNFSQGTFSKILKTLASVFMPVCISVLSNAPKGRPEFLQLNYQLAGRRFHDLFCAIENLPRDKEIHR